MRSSPVSSPARANCTTYSGSGNPLRVRVAEKASPRCRSRDMPEKALTIRGWWEDRAWEATASATDSPEVSIVASSWTAMMTSVLMPIKDQNYDTVMRSADNIESAKVLLASYINVRDILKFDKVVLPLKTIDALVAHLG